ncbi:hypothetical protein AXF42_Ash002063 [Apostasia shenzhenica]|uniref:Uncharacterized protein n=2 Tax=Apostasia shenzhenica TaxID=1088818 RepID=A0A2I0AMH5_9ASPA|nr:hypothetical protein AXF42_Ash002063 [Apostasia shenzhenica]
MLGSNYPSDHPIGVGPSDERSSTPDKDLGKVDRTIDQTRIRPSNEAMNLSDAIIIAREKCTKNRNPRNLPAGHRANMVSLSDPTVVEGSYWIGPISVPSKSLNLSSIGSSRAISRTTNQLPKSSYILINYIEYSENTVKSDSIPLKTQKKSDPTRLKTSPNLLPLQNRG